VPETDECVQTGGGYHTLQVFGLSGVQDIQEVHDEGGRLGSEMDDVYVAMRPQKRTEISMKVLSLIVGAPVSQEDA
jgi:hypothetical protein